MNHLVQRIAPIAAAVLLSISATVAEATIINFGTTPGVVGTGTMFIGAGDAQTLTITTGGYDVVFSGGTPLGPNIAFLPASASIAYGTSDFANTSGQSGYTNPITIAFYATGTSNLLNVSNFFLDLYNGNTVPVDYTVADNLGNGAVWNVGENTSAGQHTFGFASAGNSFTVTGGPAVGGCCGSDFFINNVGFNDAIPTGANNGDPVGAVPEPETYAMLLAGLGLLGFVARRRKQHAA